MKNLLKKLVRFKQRISKKLKKRLNIISIQAFRFDEEWRLSIPQEYLLTASIDKVWEVEVSNERIQWLVNGVGQFGTLDNGRGDFRRIPYLICSSIGRLHSF